MPQSKRRVAVLGATGLVGQRLVRLLLDHPDFEITALGGSPSRSGKRYVDTLRPLASEDLRGETMPRNLASMVVQPCLPGNSFECDLVFSTLPTDVARDVEPQFARAGYAVVSNASAYRMETDVPLVVPEINAGHLALVEAQRHNRGWRGCIVANPNCSTITLTLALAPLLHAFGLEAVQVTTMQALSGAGFSGPSAMDMLDNVVPYIGGEEDKLETEPCKLFGTLQDGGIVPLPLAGERPVQPRARFTRSYGMRKRETGQAGRQERG